MKLSTFSSIHAQQSESVNCARNPLRTKKVQWHNGIMPVIPLSSEEHRHRAETLRGMAEAARSPEERRYILSLAKGHEAAARQFLAPQLEELPI